MSDQTITTEQKRACIRERWDEIDDEDLKELLLEVGLKVDEETQ